MSHDDRMSGAERTELRARIATALIQTHTDRKKVWEDSIDDHVDAMADAVLSVLPGPDAEDAAAVRRVLEDRQEGERLSDLQVIAEWLRWTKDGRWTLMRALAAYAHLGEQGRNRPRFEDAAALMAALEAVGAASSDAVVVERDDLNALLSCACSLPLGKEFPGGLDMTVIQRVKKIVGDLPNTDDDVARLARLGQG